MSTTADVQTTSPSSPNLDAQIKHANATGRTPVVFVHGPLAPAEQLEPLGGAVRPGRLPRGHTGLAGRSGDRRGSKRPTPSLRPQVRRNRWLITTRR